MLYLWAVLFFVLTIILCVSAFGGVAIAVSFFTKIMFVFAFISLLISIGLFVAGKIKSITNKNLDKDLEVQLNTESNKLNEQYY